LRDEFEKIKKLSPSSRRERLIKFHNKLASMTFLDPACGCGNFLVISYRELRLLELDVLELLLGKDKVLDIHDEIKVNVNQFYGIEVEEFPAQIAQVALWLVDHQMNLLVRERFGTYFMRIPLKASALIYHGNALSIDWETIIPKTKLDYILGNPPFLGASVMSKEQKKETEIIFDKMNNYGVLDYVTCWYKKAAYYIQGTEIEVAFVSTNSICQGEQVPALWADLMNRHGIKINFAHQTFKWSNEARGKAAVYCVIIGFSLVDRNIKKIYQYAAVTSEPTETSVKQINAYLIDAPVIFIESRKTPLCNVPIMQKGSIPVDDGNLIIEAKEYDDFIKKEPNSKKYIRELLGAEEFINNKKRYCLWLADISPDELRRMPEVLKRIELCKKFRLSSKKEATRKFADFPTRFMEIRQPDSDYILIPSHSSEKRKFIPIGFISKKIITTNANLTISNAELYHLGILISTIHMAWTRYVCGRLELRYRYSADMVYNNFPWPNPTEKQKAAIEKTAQDVLDAREKFPEASLADLYDPVAMPPVLAKAHQKLDKAVEAAYGRSFDDDGQRVVFLFELYQKLSGELFVEGKKRGKG
ncbi:MAG: N-6 DNA methylase, partial [Treponema sp.]|jgi:hypothetical protein|nr:N-6 DNA methylase [Treponema sp.]